MSNNATNADFLNFMGKISFETGLGTAFRGEGATPGRGACPEEGVELREEGRGIKIGKAANHGSRPISP